MGNGIYRQCGTRHDRGIREADPPIALIRWAGWRKELLKLGDSVTIEYCPLRDGHAAAEKFSGSYCADGPNLDDGIWM